MPFEIVHTLPGRLRVRVRRLVGDPAFQLRVTQAVGRVAGVQSVRAEPRTGSVVVHFVNQEDTRRQLVEAFENVTHGDRDSGECDVRVGGQARNLRRILADACRRLDARVRSQSSGAVDLEAMVALTAGFWGVKTLLVPGRLSRWHGLTLLYWCYGMLRRSAE